MARIPRLYRVRSFHADGTVEQRHYQGPNAADERAERFRQADAAAVVTVTPSHPVTYPHPFGDPSPLDIPDGVISRTAWADLAARLGIKAESIQAIHVSTEEVVVEYQPDPAGKRAPKLWRVAIED